MTMNLAHHLLIRSAIDYYAVGRYAVFAGLNPTAGNLLHHAVETCLKGALAKKGKSTDDLKKLRHGLPRNLEGVQGAIPRRSWLFRSNNSRGGDSRGRRVVRCTASQLLFERAHQVSRGRRFLGNAA